MVMMPLTSQRRRASARRPATHSARTAGPSRGRAPRAACCAALIAAGLLAAACGSTAAPSAGSGGSATAGADAAAKVSLDVVFTGSPTTPSAHYTLRCEPAGGSVADPAAACAKLLKDPSLFGPMPVRMACPMIMATAGHVLVTGTYLGRHVHENLADGGCDLTRWETLKQVFG